MKTHFSANHGFVCIVSIICMLAMPAANANLVQWTLQNVSFVGGGTATGSFVYDADTDTYSDISITTSSGSIGGGSYMWPWDSLSQATQLVIWTYDPSSPPADLTGELYLSLTFFDALTNAGGTVNLDEINNFEYICNTASCSGSGSKTFRDIVYPGGSVVSTSVPVPAAVLLFGSGLLGLIGLARRKDT